jgi:hypothetical protein
MHACEVHACEILVHAYEIHAYKVCPWGHFRESLELAIIDVLCLTELDVFIGQPLLMAITQHGWPAKVRRCNLYILLPLNFILVIAQKP